LGDSERIRIFASLEPAKPLHDAQMCGSFYYLSVMTDDSLLICYYPILSGHLIGHLSGHSSSNMSICPFICPFMLADYQRVRTILLACLLIYPPFYLPFNVPIYFSLLFEFFSPALCCGVSSSRLQVYHDKATKFNCERSVFAIG